MPTYTVQAPDGRSVDLEGDSPPTEQELEGIFSSIPEKKPIAPTPDAGVQNFIQSQEAGPLQKIKSGIGNTLNQLITEPVKSAVRSATGIAGQVKEGLNQPLSLQDVLSAVVSPSPATIGLAAPGGRNLAQTFLEAGGRGILDLGQSLRNLSDKAASSIVNHPLETALRAAFPNAGAVADLQSRTPSQEEIDQFKMDQANQNKFNTAKSTPIVPEVVGKANVPLANDIENASQLIPMAPEAANIGSRLLESALSPVKTVKALAPKIAARIAPATVEQSAMDALEAPKEFVQQHIPVVTKRVNELVGKVPKTAEEAVDYINQAENQLYKEREEFNHAAEKQGLVVSGDQALESARNTLDNIPTMTQAQRDSILNDLSDIFSGDHTPDRGQLLQKRLNKEFSAQYENGTFDKAAPLNEAKLAIRNNIADQMDEIGKAITGRDETPYSDIGSLIEVRSNLQNKLTKLEQREAAVKTGIEPTKPSVPTSKYQAAKQISKKITNPLQKTQIERLNENVNKIFSQPGTESLSIPPVQPIPNDLVSELRAARAPRGASLDQESQIQALIKSYPRKLQSDPFLARAAAEQELGLR